MNDWRTRPIVQKCHFYTLSGKIHTRSVHTVADVTSTRPRALERPKTEPESEQYEIQTREKITRLLRRRPL